MASSFFLLLDDIASVLDDVATMTKVATKKTAGVLGDDLALNANQVAGVTPDRELPVVWAVAKGSLLNKVILVPSALAISAVAPSLISPLLVLGGSYLCFEGAEKILHHLVASGHEHEKHVQHLQLSDADLVRVEGEKIRGAVRTDFILSAEIIVISLGTVATASLIQQFATLTGVSIIMTVGVYGLVAGIVKVDDLGLKLLRSQRAITKKLGVGILWLAPKFMKFLSIAGTIAMFLVGGGILVHAVPELHHFLESKPWIWQLAGEGITGLVLGVVLAGALALIQKIRAKAKA